MDGAFEPQLGLVAPTLIVHVRNFNQVHLTSPTHLLRTFSTFSFQPKRDTIACRLWLLTSDPPSYNRPRPRSSLRLPARNIYLSQLLVTQHPSHFYFSQQQDTTRMLVTICNGILAPLSGAGEGRAGEEDDLDFGKSQ